MGRPSQAPTLELRSPKAFEAAPYGGFQLGKNWMYFAYAEDLFGYALWGSPEATDLEGLVALWVREGARPRHGLLADVSRVTQVSPTAFAVLAKYIASEASTLARIIEHAALVRPKGMNGALASGFFATVPASFPVSLWDDGVSALRQLRAKDPEDLYAAIERAIAAASQTPEALRGLRAYLDEHLEDPTLEGAARALSVSERTLQRRLLDARTTFSAEVQEARLGRGYDLLVSSEEPISTIAVTVGFATPQHFSTAFRARHGLTPSALRQQRAKAQ
jgi:AraC-like DNA-binding protein